MRAHVGAIGIGSRGFAALCPKYDYIFPRKFLVNYLTGL
jgi:hypothetical protein